MVLVRYEEVVSNYERGLQTQLRGFRPAQDFLETWVHDADPARSILSMVEAAGLEGVKALEIEIGPGTARGLDRSRLEALIAGAARVKVAERGDGLLLTVTYD